MKARFFRDGAASWVAKPLPTTGEALAAGQPFVDEALHGEAVLSVGAPLHEWRHGHIDAVVSVGPLECMPTKIAEAQWHHVAEDEGVLSLTLAFNGDPVNTAALDNFAFEVKERFNAGKSALESRNPFCRMHNRLPSKGKPSTSHQPA